MTLQPQYSLIVREIEWEIVPAALDAGLGLLPWSPLGGGWLSGMAYGFALWAAGGVMVLPIASGGLAAGGDGALGGGRAQR